MKNIFILLSLIGLSWSCIPLDEKPGNNTRFVLVAANSDGTSQNLKNANDVLIKRLEKYNVGNFKCKVSGDSIILVVSNNIDTSIINYFIRNTGDISIQPVDDEEKTITNFQELNKLSPFPITHIEKSYPEMIVSLKDTQLVNRLISKGKSKNIFLDKPNFLWTKNPYHSKNGSYMGLFTIDTTSPNSLKSDFIKGAFPEVDKNGIPFVSFQLKGDAIKKFENLTRTEKYLAIIVDNRVLTAPSVGQPITDGRVIISGKFILEEVILLASILNSPPLLTPLKIHNISYVE